MGLFSSKTIVNVQSNVNRMVDKIAPRNTKVLTSAILAGEPILDATLRMHTSQMKAKIDKLVNYARGGEYLHGLPTVAASFSALPLPKYFGLTVFDFDPSYPNNTSTTFFARETFIPRTFENFGQLRDLQTETDFIEKTIYYQIVRQLEVTHYGNAAFRAAYSYNGNNLDNRRVFNNQLLTYTLTEYTSYDANGVFYPFDGYTYRADVYIGGVAIPSGFIGGHGILIHNPKQLYQVRNQIMYVYSGVNKYVEKSLTTGIPTGNVVYGQLMPSVVIDLPRTNPYYTVSGLFPINAQTAVAEMTYPIIPIKYNGTYLNSGNPESLQVSKALNYVNINKDTLIGSLSANPDSNLIDDAYVMFGSLPNSITDHDEYHVVATTLDLLNNHSVNYTDERNNVITFKEGEFEYALEFKSIEQVDEPIVGDGYSKVYWTDGLIEVGAPYTTYEKGFDELLVVEKYHTFERTVYQITIPKNATTQTRFRLIGATGSFMVNTDLGKRYSVYKPNEDDFLLPLFENVLDFIPSIKHDRILQYSMVLVTNSIQYTKVKWYQKSFFKFLLKVVGIFLAIINPVLGTLMNTLTLGGTVALYALAKLVGMYAISKIAVEYLIDKLGKVGILLAIVVLVAIPTMSQQLTTTLDKVFKVFTSAVDTYQVYQKGLLEDVIELSDKFSQEYTKRSEELDTALLRYADTGIGLDFTKITSKTSPLQYIPNETPSQFYTRTSTIVSLPDITYGQVNSYYKIQLMLPQGGKTL